MFYPNKSSNDRDVQDELRPSAAGERTCRQSDDSGLAQAKETEMLSHQGRDKSAFAAQGDGDRASGTSVSQLDGAALRSTVTNSAADVEHDVDSSQASKTLSPQSKHARQPPTD
jgi:hypothetical protein